MASRQRWQISKEKFSREFERLNVSQLFASKPQNRHFIAAREVLGATDIQVDLSFDFKGCDDAELITALAESKKLRNDFTALEKRWKTNQKNGRPR